jgi:hypothetical protein
MTTTRTEYLRGYADGAAGRRADPPPEAEAFPPQAPNFRCRHEPVLLKPSVGAIIETTRGTTWYDRGARAKLVSYNGGSWEADFAGQNNRPGSFRTKADGTAAWWIAYCDFKVIG